MGEQTAKAPGLNRAKTYQLVLFPLNNGATNVYYVLVLSYIATFGSKVLALSMIFASVMVTGMRLFDAITDPIIGALMDRTNGKFGKFRPFMVIGNLIMAASILVLYCLTPLIPASSMFLRYAAFVALYAVWVIGYTFQTSCTRSGQTVLTNDPKQRPLFTIFNTVGSLLGMGAMQFFAPILAKNYEGGYASAGFFRTLAPVGIVISILLTILAIIGIWEKDQPKYFGIGGEVSEKVKLHEYVQIIKNNNPMQRLMVAGAGCKLALSIATNTTVLCMLYGCMMGNYDGLYLPMMVLGYVFSVPFFLLTVRTSQKEGQKASLMKYVSVAFICYIGVLVLLLLVLVFSSVKIISYVAEKKASERNQQELIDQVVTPVTPTTPDNAEDNTANKDNNTTTSEPDYITVDFAALQAKYPDVVGWLYCANTGLNYPIVQAEDNDYYLYRLLDVFCLFLYHLKY